MILGNLRTQAEIGEKAWKLAKRVPQSGGNDRPPARCLKLSAIGR
jgi:hypothetical protein